MSRGRRARTAAAPLRLVGGDLEAARLALRPPEPARPTSGAVLAYAVLMTAAALALVAVVVLGGWAPGAGPATTEVRGTLRAPP